MRTRFFVMLAIVLPVLAIFGCGEDEEDVIKLLKTDPPDGGDIDNLGKLTMTFDTEPIVVTIDSPGGSRNAKIIGKTATYTFTTDDLLVPGGKVPIGISWVSKSGSTSSKIVRLTIVAGGNGATGVSKLKIAFSSDRDGNHEIYVMNADGTNQKRLTNTEADEFHSSWSPDGTKIAFDSDWFGSEIYVMNADGTNQVNLTNHPRYDWSPSWSPDGTKIAFMSDRDGLVIYVMNADGTNQTHLTDGIYPSWSPDGMRIAFTSSRYPKEIYIMNADGTNQVNLTNNKEQDMVPSWSPDGTKIAFISYRDGNLDIYVMNADGTNQIRLTNNPASGTSPSWSPDGMKIAFVSKRDGNLEIYVMNTDGTNQTRLTNNPADDGSPSWSPLR